MDAHYREAAAAAAGMAEVYGADDSRPLGEGMTVAGTDSRGRPFVGVIEWVDPDRVVVRALGAWFPMPAGALRVVGGRPHA